MHTASMNFIVRDALETSSGPTLFRFLEVLPLYVEITVCWLLLPKLKRIEKKVAHSCALLRILITDISQSASGDLLDENMILRNRLESMRTQVQINMIEIEKIIDHLNRPELPTKIVIQKFKTISSLFSELDEQSAIFQHLISTHNSILADQLSLVRFSKIESENLFRRIDLERMDKALAQESIQMPSNLSRDEMRAFILANAQEK